jgi:ABC-2 type transport system ATP-binding protein
MLVCTSLTKRFGDRLALDKVGFSIEPGEIVALLGPNGAGKTTCMRLLAGVMEADDGQIELFGIAPDQDRTAAQSFLGYLPEGAPLQLELTIREHLQFVAEVRGIPKIRQGEAIADVAREASIADRLDVPVRMLSKGYRRRAALAAAIIGGPEILLLDEPTDGLDPNQKQVTRALLQRLSPSRVVLLSTHALDDVAAICTRVLVMDSGCLLVDEPVSDFLARDAAGLPGLAGLETTFASLTGKADAS